MTKNQITIRKFLKFSFIRIKLILPISFLLSFAIIGMSFIQTAQYSNLISTLQSPSPIGYDDVYYSENFMSTPNVISTMNSIKTDLSANKLQIQGDVFSVFLFSALNNPYADNNNTNLIFISANLSYLVQNGNPWSQIVNTDKLKEAMKNNTNQLYILNNSLFGIENCNISSFGSKNTTIGCNDPLKLSSLLQPVLSQIINLKEESIEIVLFDSNEIQNAQFVNLNWTTFVGFKMQAITPKNVFNYDSDLKISDIMSSGLLSFFQENPNFSRAKQHEFLISRYSQEITIDILLFFIMIIFGFWISNKILSAYMENNRKIFYQLIYLGGDLSNSNCKITKQIIRILIIAVGISVGLTILVYLLIMKIISYFHTSINIQTGIIFSLNKLYFDFSSVIFELMAIPILSMFTLFVFMIVIYYFVIKKVIRTNIRYLVIKSEINSLSLSEGADRINSDTVEPTKYFFSWMFPSVSAIVILGVLIFLYWSVDFRSSIGLNASMFGFFYPFILWGLFIIIIIQFANLLWYGLYRVEKYIRKIIYRSIFRVKKFEIKLLLKIKSFSLTRLKLILVILNLIVIPFGILIQFNSVRQTTANIENNINLNSYIFEFADNSFNHSNANYFNYMNEINDTLSNIRDQYTNIPLTWTFCCQFEVILPNGNLGKIYQIPNANSFENYVYQQLGINTSLQSQSFILNSKYIDILNLNSDTIKLSNFSGDSFNFTFNQKADQFPGIFENIGSSKNSINDVVGVLGPDLQFSKDFSIVNLSLFVSKNDFGAANSDFNVNIPSTLPSLLSKDGWTSTQRSFSFLDPMALTFIQPLQMYAFVCEIFVIFGISFVYMFSFTRNYTLPDKKLLHKFGVDKSTLNYSTYHLFAIWIILIIGILLIVNIVSFGFNSLIL